jgi:hypothetical protein
MDEVQISEVDALPAPFSLVQQWVGIDISVVEPVAHGLIFFRPASNIESFITLNCVPASLSGL